MRAKSFLFVCFALAGCAAAPKPVVLTRIQVERVTVPVSLLSCAAQPSAAGVATQGQLAGYILDLAAAGTDCRDDVAAIGSWQRQIEAAPAPGVKAP